LFHTLIVLPSVWTQKGKMRQIAIEHIGAVELHNLVVATLLCMFVYTTEISFQIPRTTPERIDSGDNEGMKHLQEVIRIVT